MSVIIHEVYSDQDLAKTIDKYKKAKGYEVFTSTNHSVILRRQNSGIWWITALAFASSLLLFFIRASAFEWQPLIAASVAWGAFLIVWALAVLGSIAQSPLIQIDLNEEFSDEGE